MFGVTDGVCLLKKIKDKKYVMNLVIINQESDGALRLRAYTLKTMLSRAYLHKFKERNV